VGSVPTVSSSVQDRIAGLKVLHDMPLRRTLSHITQWAILWSMLLGMQLADVSGGGGLG
jgi:hypothetical protein